LGKRGTKNSQMPLDFPCCSSEAEGEAEGGVEGGAEVAAMACGLRADAQNRHKPQNTGAGIKRRQSFATKVNVKTGKTNFLR
jgi:hypothetical protein